MKTRSIAVAGILAGLMLAALSGPAPAADYSRSVIQITATYQEYDPFLPWQKRNPGLKFGYGVPISPTEIITTENLIRNATLVEVRRAGAGEKIPATIILSDEQANLALLRIEESPSPDSRPLIPLARVNSLKKDAEVTIIQFDETSQIQPGKAQVVTISVKYLPTAPYLGLAFTLLTDLNINGEGAAVISDGKLAGLMTSYDRTSRTGHMLPYVTLNHFINDVRNPPYKGFASAGFVWMPLIDPAKRKYLNVNHDGKGILVVECLKSPGQPQALQPNDTILEWDGCVLDNLGYYIDPDFGRLAFPYLINGRRVPGDAVPVKIIRDEKETNVTVRLTHRTDADAYVPENVCREREEYLLDGGFLIRELSASYLHAYGSDWQRNADPRLVNLYLTQRFNPPAPGDRVVILSTVLPDPLTVGYQGFRDEVILKMNGEPVRNLKDVFTIARRDGHVKRLSLQSFGVDLVLDQGELAEANRRMARTYRIPAMRYQRADNHD